MLSPIRIIEISSRPLGSWERELVCSFDLRFFFVREMFPKSRRVNQPPSPRPYALVVRWAGDSPTEKFMMVLRLSHPAVDSFWKINYIARVSLPFLRTIRGLNASQWLVEYAPEKTCFCLNSEEILRKNEQIQSVRMVGKWKWRRKVYPQHSWSS